MLYQEVELYKKLSQDYDEDTPISRIGGFLDGYEIGKKDIESHWNPCSEKQPWTKCDSKEYMVTIERDDGERYVTTSFWQCYFGSWSWNDDGVIAWRELPEPYGGESE